MPTLSEDWFVLDTNRSGSLVEIRPWLPGDGTHCSSPSSRAKVPCGPPVAVLRFTRRRSFGEGQQTHTRNACQNHVAGAVKGSGYAVPNVTAEADKAAREAVLVAHWTEYQAAFKDEFETRKRAYLSQLPDELRDALLALDED